jgi:hypothetical protein
MAERGAIGGGLMFIRATSHFEKMTLLAYISAKLGTTPGRLVGNMPFEIAAITRAARPVGAVLYTNRRGTTIEMSWAGEPGWITAGAIRAMFNYPFNQLGCKLATGMIDLANRSSIEFAERLGCQRIGYVPHAFGERKDGVFYCMAYDECRWIAPRNCDEQRMIAHG